MKRFLILCLSLIAFANATHKITIKEDHAPALEASMTTSKQRVYVGEQFGINFELHAYENCMSVLGADSVDFGNNFSSYRNDNLKTESSSFGVHESVTTIPFAWWLIPNKSGTLEIPAFKFKYTSKSEPKTVKEEKQVNGKTYTSTHTSQELVEKETSNTPISLTVLPLPTRTMPTDFSGMVGSYKFKVSFDRTKIKIGETLTLIVNISGDGAIGNITNPKLPDLSDFRWELPEIHINERIEDTKVITTKDIKMTLYPRKAGTFKIPAITYSWFNPSKKKYETASAGPWTIEVE